jgi:predicted metal-dependent HD superfamily phosphohydrolase
VDNEEQSAELALSFCCLAKLPPQVADRTAALILLTKHQLPVDDTDGQLLVDIDLSILGQDPERFARYENAIRQEYAAVSETAFRDGRAAVLRKFFERDFIFHTSAFRDLYEESARANLRWSLSRLTSVA